MPFFNYQGKKIFYEEYGEGKPILLLHGNTGSSNMFYYTVPALADEYKVIVIDFLGHGQSDRLDKFPDDLWYFEAEQVIAFLKKNDYGKVRLVGSSGGALVAINVALEAPELVDSVVADSFEGEHSIDSFTQNIVSDREESKLDIDSVRFYQGMHGDDWESVVDNDTRAIEYHAKTIKNFFHKNLSELIPPIFLIGSKEDEFVKLISHDYFEEVYGDILRKIGHGDMYLFETGGHPSILSNQEKFLDLVKDFWGD